MERNGINQRNVQSTPSSPQGARPNSFEVIGSAESLVGRVSKVKHQKVFELIETFSLLGSRRARSWQVL